MLKFNFTNERWHQRNRGAVMVEFAIITPILILLVFGITEIGRALYQQNILTHQVQAAARYMARAQGILDEACTQQTTWSSAETAAKNIVVFSSQDTGATPAIPNLETDNVTVTQEVRSIYVADLDETITACAISVHAEAIFAGIFGAGLTVPVVPFLGSGTESGWGGFSSLTLNADAQERYIGE